MFEWQFITFKHINAAGANDHIYTAYIIHGPIFFINKNLDTKELSDKDIIKNFHSIYNQLVETKSLVFI